MRSVVVTGATAGFGKLLVQEFLKNGDQVIATGRKLTSRREIFVAEREQYAGRLIEKNLDVTDANERKEFAAFCKTELKTVDVLINNAGFGLFGALEDTSEALIRRQMEVNFFGSAFMIQELLPSLRASRGKIVNLSSTFGFMAFPMASLYCASKYAIEGLSESLYYELAPHGVQVCLIEPGSYRTQFSQNMAWADGSEDARSAYAKQTRNFRGFQGKLSTRSNPPNPLEVATGIVRLCSRKKLPLRAVYGKDSRFSKVFRKFTPERLFLRAIGKMTDKYINVGPRQ
jgi:NAD(P)-dependent dehydrogenase (short-subunit alcohol dehydrogenase family)